MRSNEDPAQPEINQLTKGKGQKSPEEHCFDDQMRPGRGFCGSCREQANCFAPSLLWDLVNRVWDLVNRVSHINGCLPDSRHAGHLPDVSGKVPPGLEIRLHLAEAPGSLNPLLRGPFSDHLFKCPPPVLHLAPSYSPILFFVAFIPF